MASDKPQVVPFQASSVDSIPAIHEKLHATFRSGKTKDIQFRLKQLRKLYWAIEDFHEDMVVALHSDLRRPRHEAIMTDINWCKNECVDQINNVEKWSKPEAIPGVPVSFWPLGHRLHPEPLGAVLVIGAFNFPFQLALLPLIGAMAAGNTVLLKPSEHAPACAMVMEKIMTRVDPDCYAIVNGDLPVSKAILDHKWNKIAFTGGKGTGTIIAKKAAETLTPTLLELGGLNPAFITKSSDVKLAARRLLWGKTMNAGQVCLSQNYVMVERSVLSGFIAALNASYRTFMPKGAQASPDYCRVPNVATFNRLKSMLDQTGGKIIVGGGLDESDLYVEPTVVLVNDLADPMITQESFGPIWSIVPYDNLDDAIDNANKIDSTPLALFTFGNDEENKKILSRITSGGATINDSFTHASLHCAPLGGVGESGMGSYHGVYSFRSFSHYRTIAKVPGWFDKLLRVRYMPYSSKELARFQAMSSKKVNFDREGNVNRGLAYWLSFLFTLGGSGAKSTLFRWGILLAVAMTLRLKRTTLGL